MIQDDNRLNCLHRSLCFLLRIDKQQTPPSKDAGTDKSAGYITGMRGSCGEFVGVFRQGPLQMIASPFAGKLDTHIQLPAISSAPYCLKWRHNKYLSVNQDRRYAGRDSNRLPPAQPVSQSARISIQKVVILMQLLWLYYSNFTYLFQYFNKIHFKTRIMMMVITIIMKGKWEQRNRK